MPEGNLALAQAVVYLSVAPKSNALYTAYGDVQQDVEQTAAEAVPLHLRNAPTGLMKGLGYGQGYQYAHDLEAKVADMQCLPDNLRDRVYYRPTNEGIEKRIRERLEEIKTPAFAGRRRRALGHQRKNRSSPVRHPHLASVERVVRPPSARRISLHGYGSQCRRQRFSPARALPADLVEDLQRVQKAAQRITSILDLDQLIDSVVNEVAHSFGCVEASVYLHDEERGEMVLAGVRGCIDAARTAKDIA